MDHPQRVSLLGGLYRCAKFTCDIFSISEIYDFIFYVQDAPFAVENETDTRTTLTSRACVTLYATTTAVAVVQNDIHATSI